MTSWLLSPGYVGKSWFALAKRAVAWHGNPAITGESDGSAVPPETCQTRRGQTGRPPPDGPPPHRPGEIDEAVLYGVHPVVEALKNPQRRFRRLLATENGLRRLQEQVGDLPLEAEIVRPSEIDRLLTPDSVHQGLYLGLRSPALARSRQPGLTMRSYSRSDQITDPHNVGAILRSAAAVAARP